MSNWEHFMNQRRTLHHRLLPDRRFRLTAFGEGGPQFVERFQTCWTRLTPATRAKIEAYWDSADDPNLPLIELSNLWRDWRTCFGQTTQIGMELKFSEGAFKYFPDVIADWVIAHELAHVYQKAMGRRPGGANEEENENDADEIASGWGFDNGPHNLMIMMMRNRAMSVEEACSEIVEHGFV
jgi:hypothetical protein